MEESPSRNSQLKIVYAPPKMCMQILAASKHLAMDGRDNKRNKNQI